MTLDIKQLRKWAEDPYWGNQAQIKQKLPELLDEVERFRKALEKIRDDPRQVYKMPVRHPLDSRDIREGLDSPYKPGVAAGHQHAADIARAALEPKT